MFIEKKFIAIYRFFFIFILMFFIFMFFYLWFIGCSGKIEKGSNGLISKGPTQELWDTRVNFSEGALQKAVLEAHYIAKYEANKITKAKALRLTFVDSLNMPYGFLTSDSGIVHDLTNEIEFYGNVKFFTPEGETLFADSLRWDPKDELVKTGSSVRLVRGGEYIEANGMETDIKMDRIRFLGRVRGRKREGG